MKRVRAFATLYLVFLLGLLLFPPWNGGSYPAAPALGHHWRFAPPPGWASPAINFSLMAYEAALALIGVALLWAVLPYLGNATRSIRAGWRARNPQAPSRA